MRSNSQRFAVRGRGPVEDLRMDGSRLGLPLLRPVAASRGADLARRSLRWLFGLRGSPEAIAGGVAIGILVALSPTLGMQSALAALLATVCNANRPAAVALVWLTNPVTIPPVFALTYAIGSRLFPVESLAEPCLACASVLAEAGTAAGEIMARLLVGGLLLGIPLAAVAYLTTLRLVLAYRRNHAGHPQGSRRPHCRSAA